MMSKYLKISFIVLVNFHTIQMLQDGFYRKILKKGAGYHNMTCVEMGRTGLDIPDAIAGVLCSSDNSCIGFKVCSNEIRSLCR